MEFVILGLLSLRVRSIYEIKKALEETISLFYSASLGSINSAVKRMLEKEWVGVEEQVDNGRFKKIYSITNKGDDAFQNWLGSQIEQERVKDTALTRLFFMGLLDQKDRKRVIEEHINSLDETHTRLKLLHREFKNATYPDDKKEIAQFQLLTLKYGRDFFAFNRKWYQKLLRNLEQEQ